MVQTQEITDAEVKDVKKVKGKVTEGPMEPLTIKVDPDLKDVLQVVAEKEGKTPSEVCREILEKSLSGNPDRQRATLLRSLAITKQQLSGFIELEKAKGKTWFQAGSRLKYDAGDAVKAIDRLEKELAEAE